MCAGLSLEGLDAVTCAFRRPLRDAACAAARIPRRISALFARGGRAARRAVSAKRPAARHRWLARASAALRRAIAAVKVLRPSSSLPAECVTALRALLQDAADRVAVQLNSPG